MTSFFTTLELRSHLKKFKKIDAVVVLQVAQCEPVIVKIAKVGLFTATLNVMDIDEQTWLGTEIIQIKDINAINESCIQRARTKLMFEAAGPGNEQDLRNSLQGVFIFEEGDDIDCP